MSDQNLGWSDNNVRSTFQNYNAQCATMLSDTNMKPYEYLKVKTIGAPLATQKVTKQGKATTEWSIHHCPYM